VKSSHTRLPSRFKVKVGKRRGVTKAGVKVPACWVATLQEPPEGLSWTFASGPTRGLAMSNLRRRLKDLGVAKPQLRAA